MITFADAKRRRLTCEPSDLIVDSLLVGKAASDPFWMRLHAIADQAEPDLRASILQAIADTVRGVDMAALKRALDAGNLDAAMQAIPWTETGEAALRSAYREILSDTYLQAGELSAESLGDTLGRAGVSFDLTNPRAEAWAENVGSTRVMEVSDETVSAIRSFISRGFDEGRHPYDTARMIRGEKDEETGQYNSSVIGLTENQAQAVYNYRTELENDDIERDTETEDRMVERYRDKLVLHRAEVIARNETMKASTEGQRELWLQAQEGGFLRGDERRVWIVTPDDRLCPLCDAMGRDYGDNDQGIPLDEPYLTPDGEQIMVPTDIHIQCRCAEGLVPPEVVEKFNENHDEKGRFAESTVTNSVTGERAFKNAWKAEARLAKIITPAGSTHKVLVSVGNNETCLRAAHATASILQEMKDRGHVMPQSIDVRHVYDTNISAVTSNYESPDYTTLSVLLPDHVPPTATLDDLSKAAFSGSTNGIQNFAGDTFKDMIIHEMGHVHFGSLGYKDQFENPPVAQSILYRATDQISHYAAESSQEFMAEAFTLVYHGKALGPDAAKLYAALQHPVKKWDEDKHPRAEHGRFAETEGRFDSKKDARKAIRDIIDGDKKSVTVADHPVALHAAMSVADVLHDMKAQGYEMPAAIDILVGDPEGKVHVSGRVIWMEERPYLSLTLPPNVPKNASLDHIVKAGLKQWDGGQRGYVATSYKDLVIHEMGHVQAGPHVETTPSVSAYPRMGDEDSTARTVSRYAASMPAEFIAEAFLAQYKGEKLSRDAKELYQRWGGPVVKGKR